jgi:hypothetical protein
MYVLLAMQHYEETLADPFVGTFQKNWPYYEVTIAL